MNKKENADILDSCLEKISRGEDPATVLSAYPEIRDDLEPLIGTAQSVTRIPHIVPSQEFVSTSKTQLLRRLYCEAQKTDVKTRSGSFGSTVASLGTWFTPRRLSAGLAMTIVLVLLVVVGQFTFFQSAPAEAASCYLRILSGEVSIQAEKDGENSVGIDGMTVAEGSIVTTSEDSHALLAFFDGSTIKLEAGTTLEIVRVENGEDESPVIILKQWLGRTWSRVEKMTDSESRYEIETPSATAVVRGTLFATEVTGTGDTSVATTEGLVSVFGEKEEVFVPALNKTTVKKGAVPSIPSLFQSISEIRITTEGSVVGSISDPSGSSTGTLLDGTKFNQITGSVVIPESENSQVITLTEPTSGNYNLVLRYLESGSARFTIEGIYEGETIFSYSDKLDTTDSQGIIVNFGLNARHDDFDFEKVTYRFLDDETPEKLVDTEVLHPDKRSKDDEKKPVETETSSGKKTEDTNGNSAKETAPGQNKTKNNEDADDTTENENAGQGSPEVVEKNTGNNGKASTADESGKTGTNGKADSSNDPAASNGNKTNTDNDPGNGNSSDNSPKANTGNESDTPGNSGNNGNSKKLEDEDTVESSDDSTRKDKSNNGKSGKSDNTTGKKNTKLKDDE